MRDARFEIVLMERYTLQRLSLLKKYNADKVKLMQEMVVMEYASITTDCWTPLQI